jgi:hypothetical protein
VLGCTVKLEVVALVPLVVLTLAAEVALYTVVEFMPEPQPLFEDELFVSPA